MQLTRHTDLALRVLMLLLAAPVERRWRAEELARRLDVSENHLRKVIHRLGQQGWLIPVRGRGGGVSIAAGAGGVRVGDVVRALEPSLETVDCDHPVCSLRSGCRLKGVLRRAEQAFIETLDQCRLGELAGGSGLKAILHNQD